MATVTVKHHPSGGPADPLALVDGPTYDADPHIVTGLDQVDNTSDVNKPVSTAQAAAIAAAVGGSWTNTRLAKTAAYAVLNADKGSTIAAGGSTFYALTFNAASGYDANFSVIVINEDAGRGKAIALNGLATFVLWPGQSIIVYNDNNVWQTLGRSRWKPPATTTLNFYSDFTNGNDTVGATDGLSSGASAFRTAERCFLNAGDQIDFNAANQTKVICNLAAATVDTVGMHSPVHALTGAQGGAAYQIVGASLAISNVVSNGGLCKITVPSTASYSANQVVSVYSVGGATGCNGTWKVTVTDGTNLTLQGTTFGGAYTSGGTVTNGSSFNVAGDAAVALYFGSVIQFSNVTFAGGTGLAATAESYVYLLNGNIFGSCSASAINVNTGAQIHISGDIGISASSTNAFFQCQQQGLITQDNAYNINFVPGVNPSFSGLGFAYCDTQSQISVANVTINLNGNTVTGPRFQVLSEGLIDGTGANLTFFPGTIAGTVNGGGSYDNIMTTSVAQGGTGAGTFTAHAPLLGQGTSAVSAATYSAGTDGLPLVSNANTSADASFKQIASSAITGLAASATTDTTSATNISSGTLPDARLSNTITAAGPVGDGSHHPVITYDAHGRLTTVTNTAVAIASGAVSGLAASATTDTTNAANISSGTLPNARLTAGQFPGTTTNDNATAGNVGEYFQSAGGTGAGTVTISNASPAVFTQTSHGMTAANNNYSIVNFTTSGGLPTGLTVGTNYYKTIVDANTYKVSTSVANAIAGTFVNTSSAGSGVHTAVANGILATATAIDVCGISLTTGDWDITAAESFAFAGTTNVNNMIVSLSSTSATLDVNSGRLASFNFGTAGIVPGGGFSIPGTTSRFSLASTTTLFLIGQSAFTVSTGSVYGMIRARRVR